MQAYTEGLLDPARKEAAEPRPAAVLADMAEWFGGCFVVLGSDCGCTGQKSYLDVWAFVRTPAKALEPVTEADRPDISAP